MINSGYNTKSINESFDPFKGLKKCKNDPAPGKTLPSGFVTDGNGNIYIVPKSGHSAVVKYKGHEFRYNYSTNEIEAIDFDYSIGLQVGGWFDNPEYWCDHLLNSIE